MRPVSAVLAVLGGCALVAAVAIQLAPDPAGGGWVLVGPGPFYVVGLIWVLRRPFQRVAVWLLACGTFFLLDVCLGDAVLPLVHTWPYAWMVWLIRSWATGAEVVAAIGLIGLFPAGAPQRTAERWVLRVTSAAAAALPLLFLVSNPTAPRDVFPGDAKPGIASPLYIPALRPAGPVAAGLYDTFSAWTVIGLILLYLRYRRSSADDRRRIRWLLAGAMGGLASAAAIFAVSLSLSAGVVALATIQVLWVLLLVFVLGSLIAGTSRDGLLGIDRSARRSLVYRALWAMIAIAYLAAAAALGLLASHFLSIGPAVLLAVGATLLLQPAQRRLERLADRWVFGARLDGYEVLTRFGRCWKRRLALLTCCPGSRWRSGTGSACSGRGCVWTLPPRPGCPRSALPGSHRMTRPSQRSSCR
jgi:hypothetical protein